MSTENIVSKKYRILSDVANKVWDVISFFTLAKDVELANGKNLETTCGSITGITSSLTSTSKTMAASASAIKALNDKITELNSNLSNIKATGFLHASANGSNSNTSFDNIDDNIFSLSNYTLTAKKDVNIKIIISNIIINQVETKTYYKLNGTLTQINEPTNTKANQILELSLKSGDTLSFVLNITFHGNSWSDLNVVII